MDARFLAFLGIAALLTVTPGADTAVVTRVTLARGRRAALRATLGINTGVMAWALASALGISALLAASTLAFTALKLAGAAYLVYLGVATLRQAQRHGSNAGEGEAETEMHASAMSDYRMGLATNLLNPKVGVFYTTFLPQFIGSGQPVFLTSILLAVIHNVMGFAWLNLYAAVVTALGDVLRRPAVRARLDLLTGLVLISFGARLATEGR